MQQAFLFIINFGCTTSKQRSYNALQKMLKHNKHSIPITHTNRLELSDNYHNQ
ncbi:hypothetical protein LX69_02807 [Breznakibacter xylanolyticus]|uniref:Uncharacterized protein n=1 Tax=Breznakibacter xylanolyticus TaxID=990 RepID=A0A2W7NNL1_9BACT|nr:hypothetical protein LX69_02807 [Breznakibacter xylanolyticus]